MSLKTSEKVFPALTLTLSWFIFKNTKWKCRELLRITQYYQALHFFPHLLRGVHTRLFLLHRWETAALESYKMLAGV